jgi:hypothetical protein
VGAAKSRAQRTGHAVSKSKHPCPKSGKIFALALIGYQEWDMTELDDLLDHLASSSRLSRSESARLVDEIFAFFDESPEAFVCRRHRALQGEGLANGKIFARITAELACLRFRAPSFSERQLRRIIYG